MSNTLNWAGSIKHAGRVYAPYGKGRTAIIDPNDIAECAVKCLLQPKHLGRSYSLTGPQALSNAEQVEIIGRAIGRSLDYVDVPPSAAREGMIGSGMPASTADAVLGTLAAAEAEFASVVTDDVAAIVGRPPVFFEDWVAAHQDAFR